MALMVALTLMTGLFSIVAGIARLGFIANFLSQPILVGYLNGIALIILVGQLPKLFGFASEAAGFFPKVAEFVEHLDVTHPPGPGRRFAGSPRRVAAPGVAAARRPDRCGRRHRRGRSPGASGSRVSVLGSVPAGFPSLQLPSFDFAEFKNLFRDAAGITLISFTSGVLTAKSFARRNRYNIDANQELVAFGACNLASGLAQGFPVTGAASRTAVNDATGGRTQIVGIVAGGAMLVFLLFLTAPLAYLPTTALAAVIIVSACRLFDFALRSLWSASGRELSFSVGTTVGVLIFGVLPGVLLAVVLSLIWLLSIGSRPHDAVLGRVAGARGSTTLPITPRLRPFRGS
jgi:MFS superfamily sulfate permease-like transporter